MDKRGEEDLWMILAYVLIILAAATVLLYWINNSANGKLVKDEVAVKQAALLIDSAKPGSTIFIDQNLSISGSNVKAGASEYQFFSRGRVSSRAVSGGTEILIT